MKTQTGLFYRTFGVRSSPAVVLMHGFPFSHEMWNGQVSALQEDHFVISFDLRGHGQSDVGSGQYLMDFFVDDLWSLLDELQIRKAVVCGLSMGGYIALRAIERDPERVSALIACDTKSEADSDEVKLKRAAAIRQLRSGDKEGFIEGQLKAVFSEESLRSKPIVVENIRRVIRANPVEGICGALIAMAARTNTTPSLEKIKVPTLIVVGEEDKLTPVSAAQSLHSKIPGSKLEVISAAAHMSNLENPQAFDRALIGFLAGCRAQLP